MLKIAQKEKVKQYPYLYKDDHVRVFIMISLVLNPYDNFPWFPMSSFANCIVEQSKLAIEAQCTHCCWFSKDLYIRSARFAVC